MRPDPSRRYAFGPYTLDARRRSLHHDEGRVVPTAGRSFDALLYLVEHAGERVSRDELMAALWPDVVVEDNTLSRAILQVRRALGDGYVVTLKGHGYQFVAAVRELPAPGEERDVPVDGEGVADGPGVSAAPAVPGRTSPRVPVPVPVPALAVAVAVLAVTVPAALILVRTGVRPAHHDEVAAGRASADERAMEFFESGRLYEQMHNDPDRDLAARQYRRAVDRDPDFALAWARLSIVHNEVFWFQDDSSEARAQLALEAAERAVGLQPDLAEAHMALGWYHYHVSRDREAAVAELERAVAAAPENGEIHWRLGIVQRRYGALEEALGHFEAARRSGRVTSGWTFPVVETLLLQRRYDEARELCDRTLEAVPDHAATASQRALIPLFESGDAAALRRAAPDPALEVRGSVAVPRPLLLWVAALYDGDFDAAVDAVASEGEDAWHDGSRYLSRDALVATALELGGRSAAARRSWQRAHGHAEGVLARAPDLPEARLALAEATVRVGDPVAAVEEARAVIEHWERLGDPMSASEHRLEAVLRVFVPAGALDTAFSHLGTYLREPGMWSRRGLAGDPRLAPLRDDPRWSELPAGASAGRDPG